MKRTFGWLLMGLLVATAAPIAQADTTTSRATITRSEAPDQSSRDRDRASSPRGESNTNDGAGVLLNITTDPETGEIIVVFEAGDVPNTSVSVSVNGQTVTNTGNQNTSGNNNPDDGADGTDGTDGTTEDDESEGASDTNEDNANTDDRANTRPDRDLADRDTRTSRR